VNTCPIDLPNYNLSAETARNNRFSFPSFLQTRFMKGLPSNGHRVIAFLVADAWQRVYRLVNHNILLKVLTRLFYHFWSKINDIRNIIKYILIN
jgi:hypothetical protein